MIKIEAAQRLKEDLEVEDMTLKSVVGIEGDLVSLKDDNASYTLHDAVTQATLDHVSKKLRCKPTLGKQGTTEVYVWEPTPDIGFALYIPQKGKATFDIYDR